MRVEHKLSPVIAAYAARTLEQLQQLRARYLTALGEAKECEQEAETVRRALAQQLALVEQAEGLPRPVAPYQLRADGAALVGEIADISDQLSAISDQPKMEQGINGRG